ncbi:hypothetical protein ABZS81_06915 [Streptomyces sp. NPDC005318]|uniref:hypothetical protein n=1 Tax=unclassified Streptomyces TaxID=2593676 RepID=UPI0023F6ACC1|nr:MULTISPECIES: hypothetical protein [unclassified Streptomyces]MDF6045012.1 hypothetical protein [Streptomyces sp. JH14]
MFAYELHKAHEAELLRRAEQARVVRQARRARRVERRSGRNEDEGVVSTIRDRFVHAA